MRTRCTLRAVALMAAMLLVVGASSASANRISISSTTFDITWPSLQFGTDSGGFTCPVTMSGSFHARTIAKASGSLIGHITSARSGDCSGDARLTFLPASLPWHVKYDVFEGMLPAIQALYVQMVGVSLEVSSPVPCLFATTAVEPLLLVWDVESTDGVVIRSLFDPATEIDLDSGGFLCSLAGDATFAGAAEVRSAEGQPILVALI